MLNARRSTFVIILTTLLAFGAVEGIAWWWMHPAAAGLGQPVLAYRPEVGLALRAGRDSANGAESQGKATPPAQNSLSTSDVGSSKPEVSPSSAFPDVRSPISDLPAITPLPEVYENAAPMLRCSSGQVFHLQIHDSAGLYGAYFEWDGTDAGSVLEAFRHMPEACMGSIGMKLVSRGKPIPFSVDGQTLLFDHTVFRDPAQGGGPLAPDPLVHAFRAVWVADMSSADARKGLDGRKFDQLRAIRLKAALTRFRPTHARVIQGAIRGIANPDRAWEIFEESMLRDLTFER